MFLSGCGFRVLMAPSVTGNDLSMSMATLYAVIWSVATEKGFSAA